MQKKKWDTLAVTALFAEPLLTLINRAHQIHLGHFDANEIELCTLLNIKTGGCPENCAYCPQSAHYQTGLEKAALLTVDEIVAKARAAQLNGATRFCMGAAWRNPPKKDFPKVLEIISAVKALGLETCLTAGMLTVDQAVELKKAQLDYYNHNLDTSPEYYNNIITTHTYEDRLSTLNNLAQENISICCGGIIGLGESRNDRIQFLLQLAQLPTLPESIPLNHLVRVSGTPLESNVALDVFEFIRTVAVTRIMMPSSKIRLSAGRLSMSEEAQALCFMAGVNSIHFGEKLLVTANQDVERDLAMLAKFGLKPKSTEAQPCI